MLCKTCKHEKANHGWNKQSAGWRRLSSCREYGCNCQRFLHVNREHPYMVQRTPIASDPLAHLLHRKRTGPYDCG